MSGTVRKGALSWAFALALLLGAIGGRPAMAYQFEDLEGQWCGAETNKFVTNQIFTRDTLTVVHRKDGYTDRFPIIRFEFFPDRIRVHYQRQGRDTSVDYGNFSHDFRHMNQLLTTDGPVYKFSRC